MAREAGVSVFTVSMALRGRAGVAAETRKRVEAVAKKLGYQPSGAAAFLAQRRAGKGTKRILVGYLMEVPSNEPDFFAACEERGLEGRFVSVLNYRSPEQALRVLWQEGYEGLLLATGPHKAPFWGQAERFDWGKFAVVKLSRGLPHLAFNLVRHSAFDFMMTTLEEMWERGYRKLAVVLHTSSSLRDDQARLGAVLAFAEQHTGEAGFACEWRRQPATDFGSVIVDRVCVAWLRERRPEAVIMDLDPMVRDLIRAGMEVPGEIAAAAVITNLIERKWDGVVVCGCDHRGRERYREALRLLEQQILSGQRGLVERPQEVVVEPQWVDGETAPRLQRGLRLRGDG